MGHIGQVPEEIKTFYELALRDEVNVICEVGFNAGHSAAVFLEAKPTNVVFEFDLQNLKYSDPMELYFKERYGERFHMIKGSSFDSLPAFQAAGGRCDLMSVDGVHDSRTLTDLLNGIKLVGPGGIILSDDTSMESAVAVVEAWRKLIINEYVTDSTCLTGPIVGGIRKDWCYATVLKTTGAVDTEVIKPSNEVHINEQVKSAIKNLQVRPDGRVSISRHGLSGFPALHSLPLQL
jgi:hypothetical protein